MATLKSNLRKPVNNTSYYGNVQGTPVPGSTDFGTLAGGAPAPAAGGGGGGGGPIGGGPLDVQSDGTYELVPRSNGTQEWVKVADANGNLVGDAKEIQLRKDGQSAAGQRPVSSNTLAGAGIGSVVPGVGTAVGAGIGSVTGSVGPTPNYKFQPPPGTQTPAQVAGQADDPIIQQLIDNATNDAADNKKFSDDQVVPALDAQKQASKDAAGLDWASYGMQTAARDKAQAQRSGAVTDLANLGSQYNQKSTDLYNTYAGQQAGLSSQDQAGLSRYMSETDPLMTQLQAHGSDPNDIARQEASYSQLNGIANGNLDYTAAQSGLSQASLTQAQWEKYNSQQEDIDRQRNAYQDLRGIGTGSLDYQSQAAKAAANPEDLANQRKALTDIQNDVAGGDKNQQDALNIIKGRTGTTATAEEAYLAEMARRKFETDDRSNREAQQQDMAARGIRSGASEIAGQLADREQTSQDRVLSELGLQANAMQRARDYTSMDADQSNAMRASSQNALGLQSNLTTNMRNAGFDESYKRGMGADVASSNNQGTRLAGYTSSANQSNQIRNANDTVGMFNTGSKNQNMEFNAGQANQNSQFNAGQANTVGMFNAGQTNNAQANNQSTRLGGSQSAAMQSNSIRSANDAISMFKDNYASQEATRVGNLAGDRQDTTLRTTNQVGNRNKDVETEGQAVNDVNYGRDADPIKLTHDDASTNYQEDSDVAAMPGDIGDRAHNRAVQDTGSSVSVAGQRSGDSATASDALAEALGLRLADNAKNRALALGAGR